MFAQIRDPVGTGVAVVVGAAFGLTLAAPMLPKGISVGIEFAGDPITALLVIGTLGLVAVPLGVLLLYIVFSKTDA